MNTNEQLISQIEQVGVTAYQDASILGLFKGKDLTDIGVTKWVHKNLNDIPDAALTLAGFNPQEAKLNAELFDNTVLTAAEKLVITEVDWAQFKRWGMDTNGINMLGAKVGKLASHYLWRGVDMDGNTPITQYNFINDAGSSPGTLIRPLITTHATAGGWTTYANKAGDLSLLEGQLVAKGYNLATTIVFYPRVAHQPMTMRGSAANELSAIQYLKEDGVMAIIPLPDDYLYTAAGADPTAALFDLYAIDMSQIEIGYTLEERTKVVPPFGTVRTTSVESEVWFVPYIVPRPWADDSKIYKGVSRITAIAP